MTSKNILFIGGLLFLLLVTSCVAYFLERYNPHIHNVVYRPSLQNEKPLVSPVEVSLGDIEEEERNTSILREQITILSKPATEETNRSVPLPKGKTIATKVVQHKSVPAKKKRRTQKKKSPLKYVIVPKRKVIIEPVLWTKELALSPTGRLRQSDKSILMKFAQRAKQNRELSILISTSAMDTKRRSYLRQIRSYLQNRGVLPRQIKIELNREEREKKVVFSEQKRDKIELSLIERI